MGKTVIITGAAGNLGKATVEKFVQEGYTAAVTVSPGKKLGFYEDHPNVDIHYLDLVDEPGVEGFVNKVVNKHGSIQAALLLAGGYAGGTIHNTTGTALKKMYSLNFETAYFIARAVFDQMMKQHGGRIVFIGSRPAIKPSQGKNNLGYALAKSLLFKLAEFLNAEGASNNVVSSVIVPSTIDTAANRKAMPNADFGTWVKPEDIAGMMTCLVGDKGAALREPVLKMYGRS